MSQVSGSIRPNSVNGKTVIVPKPEHGAEVTVQSSPGGRLDLGFDPAEATAARPENSNDLVFDLGANGKVVIGGFFEVGDETLPTLALPDGVEVAATDFFANSELDMSTAAGPGRASGSGTSYADDAGSLLDGLDKYGKLGTDYWGREREVDDEALGLVSPASGELIINVAPGAGGPAGGSLNGQAFSGIFEGWNPYANLGNSGDRPATPVGEHLNPLIDPAADLVPSRLSISFIPADHETVLEFRVTVPSGVALFTVNGAGDFVPLGSPGQTLYTFGPDAFNPGATPIYLTSIDFDPNDGTPIYNATDFDVSVEADIMDPTGPKATLETSFHVIVDAVAQIADGLAGETGLDQQANASGIAASTGERNTVTLHVEASFPDHDGSESHSLIFAGVPGGWDLPDQAGLDAAFGAGVATGISRGADGNVIITLDSTAASIGGDVVFDPHDWSNERDAGGLSRSDTGPAAIKIYAVSDETPEGKLGTGGADIDIIDNNHAEKLIGDFTVSVQEDKPTIIQNLVILSDETAGVQDGTNEIAAVPASVGAVLAAAVGAAADAPFVSVAQNTFTYNLYSDGADSAAENLPAGGSLAALNFELTDGAPSGWQISGGSKEAILLYNENGVVTGRVGGPDGALAFAVVVEGDLTGGAHNGNITFIQYLALEHPDGSSANETLAADLALTLRVTDSDGDQSDMAIRINVHDDAPIGGGHIPFAGYEGELMDGAPAEAMTYAHDTAATRIPFNFGADGPNADAALLISGLPVGTDFAVPGLMTTPEFGPDGAIIKPAADLSVKQEFSGDTLSVTLSTTADGTPVAVLTVTTAGHWTYTQYHALAHANPALVENSDAPLDLLGALGRALNAQGLTAGTGLTLTLTDRDGDTATYTLESNLHDAVPTLTVNGNSLAVLDDDQHDYTAPGVQGDFVPTRIEFNVDPGADGLQSLTFADPTAPDWTAPQISGAVDNNAFEWIRSADGKTLTLYQDPTGSRTAVVEFELGAVADGKAVVTVTQLAPFMHDSTVDLADISNIPLKLVDGDGDVARAGFDVRIYDDEQGLTIDPILRGIEERGDSVLDDSGDKLFAYADGVYDAQTWSGFEGRGDIFGADGMHPDKPIDAVNLDTNATGWGGVAGGPWTSPWTVGGAAVTVTQTVGADNLIILTGRAGGVDVFTLEVQQNGHYDYKELVNIDHHGADLPLQAAFRDADGDIVNTLDCTLRVREVPIVELEPIKSTDVVLEGHEATFTLAVHTDSGAPITSLDEFIDVVLRLPVPAAANGAVPIDIDAFNALSPAEQASGNYDFLIRHADATGTNGTPPENGGGIWKWEVDDPDNPRYYEVVVRIPAGDLADGHYQFSFETVHDNVRDPSETISLDLKGILSDGIGSASGGSAVDGHANALLGGGKHAETKITDPIGPEVGLGTHPTINELQGSDPECAYDLRFVTNSPEGALSAGEDLEVTISFSGDAGYGTDWVFTTTSDGSGGLTMGGLPCAISYDPATNTGTITLTVSHDALAGAVDSGATNALGTKIFTLSEALKTTILSDDISEFDEHLYFEITGLSSDRNDTLYEFRTEIGHTLADTVIHDPDVLHFEIVNDAGDNTLVTENEPANGYTDVIYTVKLADGSATSCDAKVTLVINLTSGGGVEGSGPEYKATYGEDMEWNIPAIQTSLEAVLTQGGALDDFVARGGSYGLDGAGNLVVVIPKGWELPANASVELTMRINADTNFAENVENYKLSLAVSVDNSDFGAHTTVDPGNPTGSNLLSDPMSHASEANDLAIATGEVVTRIDPVMQGHTTLVSITGVRQNITESDLKHSFPNDDADPVLFKVQLNDSIGGAKAGLVNALEDLSVTLNLDNPTGGFTGYAAADDWRTGNYNATTYTLVIPKGAAYADIRAGEIRFYSADGILVGSTHSADNIFGLSDDHLQTGDADGSFKVDIGDVDWTASHPGLGAVTPVSDESANTTGTITVAVDDETTGRLFDGPVISMSSAWSGTAVTHYEGETATFTFNLADRISGASYRAVEPIKIYLDIDTQEFNSQEYIDNPTAFASKVTATGGSLDYDSGADKWVFTVDPGSSSASIKVKAAADGTDEHEPQSIYVKITDITGNEATGEGEKSLTYYDPPTLTLSGDKLVFESNLTDEKVGVMKDALDAADPAAGYKNMETGDLSNAAEYTVRLAPAVPGVAFPYATDVTIKVTLENGMTLADFVTTHVSGNNYMDIGTGELVKVTYSPATVVPAADAFFTFHLPTTGVGNNLAAGTSGGDFKFQLPIRDDSISESIDHFKVEIGSATTVGVTGPAITPLVPDNHIDTTLVDDSWTPDTDLYLTENKPLYDFQESANGLLDGSSTTQDGTPDARGVYLFSSTRSGLSESHLVKYYAGDQQAAGEKGSGEVDAGDFKWPAFGSFTRGTDGQITGAKFTRDGAYGDDPFTLGKDDVSIARFTVGIANVDGTGPARAMDPDGVKVTLDLGVVDENGRSVFGGAADLENMVNGGYARVATDSATGKEHMYLVVTIPQGENMVNVNLLVYNNHLEDDHVAALPISVAGIHGDELRLLSDVVDGLDNTTANQAFVDNLLDKGYLEGTPGNYTSGTASVHINDDWVTGPDVNIHVGQPELGPEVEGNPYYNDNHQTIPITFTVNRADDKSTLGIDESRPYTDNFGKDELGTDFTDAAPGAGHDSPYALQPADEAITVKCVISGVDQISGIGSFIDYVGFHNPLHVGLDDITAFVNDINSNYNDENSGNDIALDHPIYKVNPADGSFVFDTATDEKVICGYELTITDPDQLAYFQEMLFGADYTGPKLTSLDLTIHPTSSKMPDSLSFTLELEPGQTVADLNLHTYSQNTGYSGLSQGGSYVIGLYSAEGGEASPGNDRGGQFQVPQAVGEGFYYTDPLPPYLIIRTEILPEGHYEIEDGVSVFKPHQDFEGDGSTHFVIRNTTGEGVAFDSGDTHTADTGALVTTVFKIVPTSSGNPESNFNTDDFAPLNPGNPGDDPDKWYRIGDVYKADPFDGDTVPFTQGDITDTDKFGVFFNPETCLVYVVSPAGAGSGNYYVELTLNNDQLSEFGEGYSVVLQSVLGAVGNASGAPYAVLGLAPDNPAHWSETVQVDDAPYVPDPLHPGGEYVQDESLLSGALLTLGKVFSLDEDDNTTDPTEGLNTFIPVHLDADSTDPSRKYLDLDEKIVLRLDFNVNHADTANRVPDGSGGYKYIDGEDYQVRESMIDIPKYGSQEFQDLLTKGVITLTYETGHSASDPDASDFITGLTYNAQVILTKDGVFDPNEFFTVRVEHVSGGEVREGREDGPDDYGLGARTQKVVIHDDSDPYIQIGQFTQADVAEGGSFTTSIAVRDANNNGEVLTAANTGSDAVLYFRIEDTTPAGGTVLQASDFGTPSITGPGSCELVREDGVLYLKVTIPAQKPIQGDITLPVAEDGNIESTESFTLVPDINRSHIGEGDTGLDIGHYQIGAGGPSAPDDTGSLTGTIQDPVPHTVSVSDPVGELVEGAADKSLSFTVKLDDSDNHKGIDVTLKLSGIGINGVTDGGDLDLVDLAVADGGYIVDIPAWSVSDNAYIITVHLNENVNSVQVTGLKAHDDNLLEGKEELNIEVKEAVATAVDSENNGRVDLTPGASINVDIIDNDAPQISVSGENGMEGVDAVFTLTLPVDNKIPTNAPVTLTFTLSGGALVDMDALEAKGIHYNVGGNTYTYDIPAGIATAGGAITLNIPTLNDKTVESDQSLDLTVTRAVTTGSSGGVVELQVTGSPAAATLAESDSFAVQVGVDNVSLAEGDMLPLTLNFTSDVNVAGNVLVTMSVVSELTEDDFGIWPANVTPTFNSTTGYLDGLTVQVSAAQTAGNSLTINIPVKVDNLVEHVETAQFTVTGVTSAGLDSYLSGSGTSGVFTVTDTEEAYVSVSSASSVDEGASEGIRFTVSSKASDSSSDMGVAEPVTVTLEISDASGAVDWSQFSVPGSTVDGVTLISGPDASGVAQVQFTLDANTASGDFALPLTDDTIINYEGKSVSARVISADTASDLDARVHAVSAETITEVLDDERPTVNLSINTTDVDEGDSNTFAGAKGSESYTLTVALAPAYAGSPGALAEEDAWVTVTVSDPGSVDWTALLEDNPDKVRVHPTLDGSFQVLVAKGASAVDVTLSTRPDYRVDPADTDLQFTVGADSATVGSAYTLRPGAPAGITLHDDDTAAAANNFKISLISDYDLTDFGAVHLGIDAAGAGKDGWQTGEQVLFKDVNITEHANVGGLILNGEQNDLTYNLDYADPEVKNLGAGGSALQHFTYTLMDGVEAGADPADPNFQTAGSGTVDVETRLLNSGETVTVKDTVGVNDYVVVNSANAVDINTGAGNDTIRLSDGGGVVRGGAGDDLIIAKAGHDATSFIWTKSDDLGSGDVTYHDTIRGWDTAKDSLNLNDIISDEADLSSMLSTATLSGGTLSFADTNTGFTLTARAEANDKLLLTLTDTDSGKDVQTIAIEAAQIDAFSAFNGTDDDAARQLLQMMIKNG